MTETLAHWYSSDSAQQELSNEYQQEKIQISLLFCALHSSIPHKVRVKGYMTEICNADTYQFTINIEKKKICAWPFLYSLRKAGLELHEDDKTRRGIVHKG